MKKIILAIVFSLLPAPTFVQAAPRQSTLRDVVYKRALAHMQSRAGITTGLLALQGVSAAMLLKALFSRERPHSFSTDKESEINPAKDMWHWPMLGLIVADTFPANFGVRMPLNASLKEQKAWLAGLKNTIAKLQGGSAVGLFLACAIVMRAAYEGTQQYARRCLGDKYDTEYILALEPIDTPNDEGFSEAFDEMPACHMCCRKDHTTKNPLCYYGTDNRHIAHRLCAELRYESDPSDFVSLGCQIKKGGRTTLLQKWKVVGEIPLLQGYFIGSTLLALALGMDGLGNALAAYKALRPHRSS